jgi:DNA-binding transcriptional LysR family regulator
MLRPDDLVDMLVFARVVEQESFTEAARVLGVAKSMVSARIAHLEERMGTRLLHRTTRKVSVTTDGAALYDRCKRMLVEAEEAEQCASGASPAPRGTLRVNAPIAFGILHLAAPIADFLGKNPDVHVDLSLSDRFVDLVGEGLDVVIRIATRLEDSSLNARRLATDRRVICGSPAYLAARGTPASAADLANHNCLGYSLRTDEWRLGADAVAASGNLASDNGLLLREAALAGLGLVVVPSFMVAAEVAAGTLVEVLTDLPRLELGVHALHAAGALTPAKVRAFVDHMVASFKAPPWEKPSLPAAALASPAPRSPTRASGGRRGGARAADR